MEALLNHDNILEEIYSMVDGDTLAASSRVSKSWHRVLDRMLKKKRILSFIAIYDGDGTAWTLFLNKRPETILYLEHVMTRPNFWKDSAKNWRLLVVR